MSYFQLTNAATIYELGSDGSVIVAGNSAGSWTTNAVNQIIATLGATVNNASTVAFDVSWMFNGRNQLTIASNGTEIFNFSASGLHNSFTTREAALLVQPDRLAAFTFALQGDWEMSADHNLTFTMGGVASLLDGFISDPLGRFIFHFANKDNVLQTNVLGFAGFWQSRVNPTGAPLLDFHYQTSHGARIFGLPKPVAVNPSSNQLTYAYVKGNKNLSLDFQGMLMVGADFEITYVVQPQVSSTGAPMVQSNTLAFQATLTRPNLHGDFELSLTRPDGTAGDSTLTISGQYQGVLGKTSLQVGFSFTQIFGGGGNQISRTAAFSGTIALRAGQVQWTFSATGSTIDLAVGVDIKLGPVQLDARLNMPMDGGQTAGVSFLLGISF